MQHFDSWKAADGFILKFDTSAAQQNAGKFLAWKQLPQILWRTMK